MSEPTCLVADTICRTVELGVTIFGAAIADELTWIDCRPVAHDPVCPKCGQPGGLRDHVVGSCELAGAELSGPGWRLL